MDSPEVSPNGHLTCQGMVQIGFKITRESDTVNTDVLQHYTHRNGFCCNWMELSIIPIT